MVNSDLEKLGHYLKPSEKKMKSKGIDSVRSRVTNISEANSEVTIENLKQSMDDSFCKIYSGECIYEIFEVEVDPLIALYDKYSSWQWRFGQSPKFDVSYTERFVWGEIEIDFSLKDGLITEVNIFTDAMDVELFSGLDGSLKGCKFQRDEIKNIIEKTTIKEEIKKDILMWLNTLEL